MIENRLENITKLYRAVGLEEYILLADGEKFHILRGGVAVKYFGRNFDETLIFANKPINNGIVAIFEVGIPESVLKEVGDFVNVDKFIFKSGAIEIPEERMDAFNSAIQYVKHIY